MVKERMTVHPVSHVLDVTSCVSRVRDVEFGFLLEEML